MQDKIYYIILNTMKAIEVKPPAVYDTLLLDHANEMFNLSVKYKDTVEAKFWLDKVIEEAAKLLINSEEIIDDIYYWVMDHDEDFSPMYKETYEQEIEDYISENTLEVYKKYLISQQ